MEHVRTKGNEELRAGVIDHFTMRYASSIQAPQDIGTLDGWDENRCGEQKHSLEIAVTFHSVFPCSFSLAIWLFIRVAVLFRQYGG